MQKAISRTLLASASFAAILSTTPYATPGLAADGIELIGFGARQKAVAGADVADSVDAMSMSINPAGIVGMERQYQFGISAEMPVRGYEASGPLVVLAPGDVQSGRPIFPVPNSANVSPIDAESAWGTVSYGNGGINTSYGMGNFKPPIYAPAFPLPGVASPLIGPSAGGPFGGGFAGIDYEQAFFSVVYAHKIGAVTLGLAPTLAAQTLNIQGIKTLAPWSSDPYHLSDNGYDYSFGGGIRLGLLYEITKGLRFGAGGATPMFMTQFGKYAGAIGQHGKLDVPADVTAGFAYDLLPELTIMVDWKHIFYSGVPAFGNPSTPIGLGALGSFGGPGFGWRDTDSEAFGVEWRATKQLTLRAGYRHSSAMIGSQDVTLNVLAPAITAHHATGGFKYELTKNSSIDFAAVYAFKNTLSGQENAPYAAFAYALPSPPYPVSSFPVVVPPHYGAGTNVTASLSGLELSLSYTYKFDAGDNSWIPTHF
jgi:long-chain fatty acid transport protein